MEKSSLALRDQKTSSMESSSTLIILNLRSLGELILGDTYLPFTAVGA